MPAERPASPPAPLASDSDTQATLDRLVAAGRERDRAAYTAEIDPADAVFAPVAQRWFANIGRLPWSDLSFRVVAPAQPRADSAWSQNVEVRWRLTGATRPARQQVRLALSTTGGRVRVAGWEGPSGDAGATPLWLLQPLVAERRGAVSVLAADPETARRWLAPSAEAEAAVRREVPATLRRDAQPLTVQVPSTRELFEATLGVGPGSYAEIAGVAWPLGPDGSASAASVVVNPGVAERLPAPAVAVLLTHEATHVALASPGSPAPTWLVEGYADFVAYAAHPGTRAAAARPALDRVRAAGPPRRLPIDADFDATGTTLDVAYAQAWLLCLAIAEQYGPSRLDALYAAADSGTDLTGAIRTTLGVDETALVDAWATDLRRWTARPPW